MRFKRKILFLGAGFSHNYGGYLTTQLWEHIYNQPDISKSSRITREMRENFNVEEIPDRLKTGRRSIFMSAVKEAFSQHESILDRNISAPSGFLTEALREWLRSFAGEEEDEFGFIFSLNVDLLIEKLADKKFTPMLPGLPPEVQPPLGQGISRILLPLKTLSRTHIDKESCGRLNLVKLHGSINWQAREGSSKTRLMVFGNQKSKTLKRWPLLAANFSKFNDALRSGWVSQVWIVGYGFGDEHINEAICDACEKEKGLGLFIIAGATRPELFFGQLREKITDRQYYVITNRIRAVITNSFSGIFNQPLSKASIPWHEISQL